jgi:hypothetical protein
MPAYAVVAGAYLPHAAPDAAGNVGALHHDTSPDAPGIVRSGLLFFCEARSAVETSNRNPPG